MGKGKARHVQTPTIPQSSGHIPGAALPPSGDVLFSFKYYEFSGKFSCLRQDGAYMDTVLGRFKDLSGVKPQELVNAGKSWRCHPIEWEKTSEPQGFTNLPPQLSDYTPMQIGLGKAKGRIHGVFSGDIFYLVWFDAEHQLWPEK